MSVNGHASRRDSILYKAFDLFRLHRTISCPTCGHQVETSDGKKKSQLIRNEILSIFKDHVPNEQDLHMEDVERRCSKFIDTLEQYAEHALGGRSATFIADRMRDFVASFRND